MGKVDINKSWNYAAAPESTAHIKLKKKYDLFIGGDFVKPLSKKYFDTINPANGEQIAKVAEANEKDVNRAVKAARKAFKSWSKLSAKERGKYIFRIARMMQERAREFAVIESLDGGKPIRESRDIDIPLAANHFFYYAGWADKLEYAFPNKSPKPLGVAGQIIPWNFPLLMAAWKIAPAIACGNTVVLKPAETTSLTALKLAEIIHEFHSNRKSLIVDRVGSGFIRALYATYLSYLRPEFFSYHISSFADERGVFTEVLKTKDSGQFSFFTSKPGEVRGGHYHHTKNEKFLVVLGKAKFNFRNIMTNEEYSIDTNSNKLEIVETVPGWAHSIENIGDTEMLVILWANEVFNEEESDTHTYLIDNEKT